MKQYIISSIKLTAVMILLSAIAYPLLIAAIGILSRGNGNGETVTVRGKVVGYQNIGQRFTRDEYFWGRPSAVNYNAAGSGGSNKAPSNADYLKTVQDRVDHFLVHNPAVQKKEIPVEMVTASGSGLDPDISHASALVQVKRIASARKLTEKQLLELIGKHTTPPLLGVFGPEKINVLQLNIALDELKPQR